MPNWGDILTIIAAVASLSAVILAWRKAPAETRQINAQSASVRIDTIQRYESQVARYAEEIDRLRIRLDAFEVMQKEHDSEISELRAGVVLLIAQLEANHMQPVWRPRERKAAA